jgi:hypothetical protein
MTSTFRAGVVGIAFVCLVATPAAAGQGQSLGEVARQTELARKKARGEAAKVKTLTNRDVAPTEESAPTAATPKAETQLPAAAVAPTAKASEEVRDESYWRNRSRALHQKLEADMALGEQAVKHMNAAADIATAGKGLAQAIQIPKFTEAEGEVRRLIGVITGDKQAIADLEEEARRANVPPGWLRY